MDEMTQREMNVDGEEKRERNMPNIQEEEKALTRKQS